jgi:outer membrane protein assembly factor BamC
MKFSYQLTSAVVAAFFLSACAESPMERNQAKDDFAYLETPAFSQWQSPDDAQPQFNREYVIPKGNFSGETGPELDIRPPLQVLELISGVRVDHEPTAVTLWTVQQDYADTMWSIINKQLQSHGASVTTPSAKELNGQGMRWMIGDEEGEALADYRFTQLDLGSRKGIRIEITNLKNDLNLPSQQALLDRYTVAMANLVTTEYDGQLRAEAQRKAQLLGRDMVFTMGTDRSGLPVIIARAVFDTTWQRIPTLIDQIGFEVTDKSQSQGSMKVQYRGADKEVWQKLAIEPLTLERKKYTLLFGDLGNRTSINITDSDGKLLSEAQIQSLVPVLTAIVNSEK